MAKDIKIYMLHKYIKSVDDIYQSLHISQNDIHFIWDDQNPDYIIATEWIYYEPKLYQKFMSLQCSEVINIFFAGECLEPDLNIFDYAIVFDNDLQLNDRICKIPTLEFFHKYVTEELYKKTNNPSEILRQKTKFCNFIYSNGKAHPNRDKLFYKISEYKKVDALGQHLRNIEVADYFVDERVKKDYKFTIASENACYRGYTSEKLLLAFQAHTVPIYWGDPDIEKFFNPKAFINANKMSFDEVVEKVKELDNNDELYCQMLSEPPMTEQQKQIEYQVFISNIFMQSKENAKRVAEGFHPENYRRFAKTLISQDVYNPQQQDNWLYSITSSKGKVSVYLGKYKILSYHKG